MARALIPERRQQTTIPAHDDLASIEATLEPLGEAPARARIARAEDDIARGDALDEADLRAPLAGRGENRE